MSKDGIEKKVYGWVAEVGDRVGADRLGNLFGGALVGVAKTKATLDKNLDALLAVANIPSRGDYRRMQSKLDSLQGSVMSLSRTVEQLRAALANGSGNGKSAPKAKRGRPLGSTNKAKTKTRSGGTSAKTGKGSGRKSARA
jgi:hypothetical protein